MMKPKNACLSFLISMLMLLFGAANIMAEETKPTASGDIAILSQYIWRGQELSRDSVVIQPSMTMSYMGFSANLWGNLDTDQYKSDEDSNWNETDFTLSYAREFGMLSAELGYIYYSLDGCDDTQEFFLALGLDTFLSPSLTIYKDTDTYPMWYFLLGLSHTFEITEKISLELSGSVSYLLSNDEDDYPEIDNDMPSGDEFDNFHDGVISANLPITVNQYVTVTPTVSYVFPLSGDAGDEMEWRSMKGDDDNFFYGGVIVSMAF
jgi:uncharacterized protein (TIGR02001 family)